jgi:hypothetical protein
MSSRRPPTRMPDDPATQPEIKPSVVGVADGEVSAKPLVHDDWTTLREE